MLEKIKNNSATIPLKKKKKLCYHDIQIKHSYAIVTKYMGKYKEKKKKK